MISSAALTDGARGLGLDLTRRQSEQLIQYGLLLLKWNKVYNLTALREPGQVLTHHLLDSMAVIGPLAREQGASGRLLDVGSGAGLPGVVVAIMRPDIEVDCLDAVAKKMAFVQQVASEVGLPNLRALHQRVEQANGAYDLIASRAFASLNDFFLGSMHLLADRGGRWMAMKGKPPLEEIAQVASAAEVFHVEPLVVPGLDAERCLVWARKREL